MSQRDPILDRFIRSRSFLLELNEERIPMSPVPKNDDSDIKYFFKNVSKEKYCATNYQNCLKIALFPKCLLKNFNEKEPHKTRTIPATTDWPVEARKKPVFPSIPLIILDMPDLHTTSWKNMVDWGNTDFIATTYNGEIYFWNPDHRKGFNFKEVFAKDCVRWNRAGSRLAVSLVRGQIAVYHFFTRKVMYISLSCPCNVFRTQDHCEIISMDWTSSNRIITGCSKGAIVHWSPTLKVLNCRIRAHYNDIIKVTLSCDQKYLVTSGKDNVVLVWSFPWLELIQSITFMVPTKAIAWHPWKNSLLAVGHLENLYLLNIQSKKILTSSIHSNQIISNISFNPRSAELVLSTHDTVNEVSYLKVMKNMNTVVDEIRCNEDRIPYLMWDSTGTKLGTASTDENFCIWNFFGRSTELEKKYLKAHRTVFSTDPVKNINAFGNTIR